MTRTPMVKAGIAERTLRAPVLAFRPDAPTGAVFGFAMFDTSDLPRRAFARRSIMASRRLPKRPQLTNATGGVLAATIPSGKQKNSDRVRLLMSDWVQSA